jgi:hypothetical protein
MVIKSRRMRETGHVEWHEIRSAYKILVGNPEGKSPLGRPKRKWQDHIMMDLREVAWQVVDWIYLAQNREQWRALLNTVMNLRIPYKAGNFFLAS